MITGLIPFKARAFFDIKGETVRQFLNGILTNNIQMLKDGEGCYSCLCSPKGKLFADLFVYACHDRHFCLDCDSSLQKRVAETLKKYIIFQKIEVLDRSDRWQMAVILGPKAKEESTKLKLPVPSKLLSFTEGMWNGNEIWLIEKTLWGLPAIEIWTHKGLDMPIPLPQISEETQEMLRIESATPKFGIDMNENTLPQEANLYSALSFDKGCYVGQEIIARLENRGHVAKRLMLIQFDGKNPPQVGEKIFAEDKNEIGWITSSCFSPKHNAPIALGYIKYDWARAETAVQSENQKGMIVQLA